MTEDWYIPVVEPFIMKAITEIRVYYMYIVSKHHNFLQCTKLSVHPASELDDFPVGCMDL